MSHFKTLGLREPADKAEKAEIHKLSSKQRQKNTLRELLVQNLLKKFASRIQHSEGDHTMISMSIARVVGQQVDLFLAQEEMTEKNLRGFEVDLENILKADPKIGPILASAPPMAYRGKSESRIQVSQSQQQISLPKIQTARENFADSKSRSRLGFAIMNQVNPMSSRSQTTPFGLNTQAARKQSVGITPQIFSNIHTTRQQHSTQEAINKNLARGNPTSKSFADLRLKLGDKKQNLMDDNESQLSEQSTNEWHQIQQYEKQKFEAEKSRKVVEEAERRRMIKETLDRQIKERNDQKQKVIDDKKAYDARILENIRQKEEIEVEKDKRVKDKMYRQKEMNDIQLLESKLKKEIDYKNQRQNEIDFVHRLKSEIQDEKSTQLQKRIKEREVAQQIISENIEQKQKIQDVKSKEKAKENQLIEEYNLMVEDQERRRKVEWDDREGKIKSFMDKMSDGVRQKDNAGKDAERRAVQHQLAKEEREAILEQIKKEEMRKKHEEIRHKLDSQLQEKQLKQKHESFADQQIMKKWIAITEDQETQRKGIEQGKKAEKLKVQEFQLRQMGLMAPDNGNGSVTTIRKKKKAIDEPMTAEEIRINKELLKEIQLQKKKEREEF